MNFHKGFHSYEWIRGQEYDSLVSFPAIRKIDKYIKPNYVNKITQGNLWYKLIGQFLANTDSFTKPEDWISAKVFNKSIDWIKKNRVHENIFLWIDSFDPHEPCCELLSVCIFDILSTT